MFYGPQLVPDDPNDPRGADDPAEDGLPEGRPPAAAPARRRPNEPPKPTDPQEAAWRDELAAESYVDARHENGKWYYAIVQEVQANQLFIRFVERGEVTVAHRYSPQLAQPGTKCTDEEEEPSPEPAEQEFDTADDSSETTLGQLVAGANPGLMLVQLPNGQSILMRPRVTSSSFQQAEDALRKMLGVDPVDDTPVKPEELSKEDRQWREELKVGSIIDALDTANQWYIAEILEETKEGMFKISYTEWQSRWDTWVSRWSNRITTPKTKSKLRSEQDPYTMKIQQMTAPNYADIDVALTDNCVTRKSPPPHVGKGRIIVSKMPADHSCLFHAVAFVCAGQVSPVPGGKEMLRNRKRCSDHVRNHANIFTEAELGMSNVRYSDRLTLLHEWGGAIELQILSEFFQVEIISFDAVGSETGPRVYKFPSSNHNYTKRVFLVYRMDHYDALAFLHADRRQNQLQEFFAVSDLQAFKMARKFVELMYLALHRKRHCSMQWKGLAPAELTPVLARTTSQTADPPDQPPIRPLKRTQSEQSR